MVDGASTSCTDAPLARIRRRLAITIVAVTTLAVMVVALTPSAQPAQVQAATTSTTIFGPVFPLAAFPVQGPCSFIDTYGAPRSGGRTHEGVDLIAKTGQFVYAASNGTLTKQFLDATASLSGNGWRLTAADGSYFFYAHLSAFATGLTVGSKVVAGQIIGYVGMTGDAGIPHLHFEIHPGGGASINPTPSVRAIDGCSVTAVPPVATNPTDPSASTTPGSTAPGSTTPGSTIPRSTTTTTSPPSPGTGQSIVSKWQFIEPVVVFNGASSTSLTPGVTKHVKISGVAGISPSTAGVLVRVSATMGSAGSVVVHPCGGAAPLATTLFVEPGPMAIGSTIVGVANGEICVTSTANASAKLTVVGQLLSSGVGVAPIVTTRVLDSRISGKLAANRSVTISPKAFGDVTGVQAVTVAFTILGPAAAGTLSVGPCGGTPLKAPFARTSMWAFTAVLSVSAAGLCASSSVATNLVIDVDAVWLGNGPALMPVKPVRIFDSRDLGQPVGATPVPVNVVGFDGAPSGVSAVAFNLTVLGGAAGGSVFVWPCEKPMPSSVVAAVAPNKRGTFSVVAAVSGGVLCVASNQPVTVIIDVTGVA